MNDFAKKIGITEKTLGTYRFRPERHPIVKYLHEVFKPKISGRSVYYKDPTPTELRALSSFKEQNVMTERMRNFVTKLHKELGPVIKETKKLPALEVVQDALEIKSPATAANAMRHLARAYKGDLISNAS